jgi:hypothetical protein
LAGALACSALVVCPAPSAHAARALRVAPQAAVPGQVVVLSSGRVAVKRASVRIGGRRARVVSRGRRELRAVVPGVRAGRAQVVVQTGGRRLRAPLRVRHGFSGRVRPTLERSRAASALIGPAGGTVAATGSDGTRFSLTIPPRALRAATRVRLTPVERIRGFPLKGRRVAVQFSPDGLALLEPATLRMTLARAPDGKFAGFAYDGSGRDFTLDVVRRSGRTIVMSVEHFSSAGSTQINGRDLIILLGRLAAKIVRGTLDFDDVHLFATAWSVVFVGNTSLCTADPTCNYVFSGTLDWLAEQAAEYSCLEGNVQRGSDAIEMLREALQIDADMRLLGDNRRAAEFELERRCLTVALVGEADPPAASDPLAATRVPIDTTDATRADADGDGVTTCEWAVYVAGIAAQQGFTGLQAQASGACESGLGKVLDDGARRCDEDRAAGLELLQDGQKVALAVLLLTADYQAAIDNCKPKLFVTPPVATVEVDQTATFSARTNEGDGSFDWTASSGTIDGNGTFTAPSTPGTVTVTATTRRILSGSATVTVKCPAGQVEFAGECRTISVTVAPGTVTLEPGATQQFSATVNNTTNQAVTWTASGGSITAGGFYTAPAQPGPYTITARSKEDATKIGTASVAVGVPGVNVRARSSTVNFVSTIAETRGDNNCPPGSRVVDNKLLSRPSGPPLGFWDSNTLSTSAAASPVFCPGGSSGEASGAISTRTVQDVESEDGDFSASSFTEDSHALFLTRSGTAVTNQVTTTALTLLGVVFDVVGETVELSCSTTLSGDPRDPQPQEAEDTLLELQIGLSTGGPPIALLEDTTAPTIVTLPPGSYQLTVENKTTRRRGNQTADLSFTFGGEGECHRVS